MLRTIKCLGLLTLMLAGRAEALQTVNALGCVSIASFSTATGLGSVPSGATAILLTVNGNGVNFRDDGTAPTAATTGGVQFPVGTSWYAGNLTNFQMIPLTGSTTAFYCAYK